MAAADGCALSVPGLKDVLTLNKRAPPPNVSVKKSEVHVGDNIYCQGTVNMYVDTSSPDIIKSITNGKPVTVNEGWRGRLAGLSRKEKAIYLTAILSVVGVLLLFVCIYFPLAYHAQQTDEDYCEERLKTFCRDDWFAVPPSLQISVLDTPAQFIIISSSQTSSCRASSFCKNLVRNLQLSSKMQGLGDIAFNFVVGGDGAVYVGRGWDFQGRHTRGYFNNSIGVIFLGEFQIVKPSQCQLRTYNMLIDEGICLGKIVPNYTVHYQREIIGSDSPGTAFIQDIKRWTHYRPGEYIPKPNSTESPPPTEAVTDIPYSDLPNDVPSNKTCSYYPTATVTPTLSGLSSCPKYTT